MPVSLCSEEPGKAADSRTHGEEQMQTLTQLPAPGKPPPPSTWANAEPEPKGAEGQSIKQGNKGFLLLWQAHPSQGEWKKWRWLRWHSKDTTAAQGFWLERQEGWGGLPLLQAECVSSQTHTLNPNPQCVGSSGWGLWDVISS